jgi:hypothetical protein
VHRTLLQQIELVSHVVEEALRVFLTQSWILFSLPAAIEQATYVELVQTK